MIKILAVDDEHDVCDFVKTFFEQRNFKVYTASDGEAALRLIKREKPNIILLDIRMKNMDGMQTLKRIRDIDKEVKVIMVTAVEDQDQMDTACKLGACEYITKPLVLENLEAIVSAQSKGLNNV